MEAGEVIKVVVALSQLGIKSIWSMSGAGGPETMGSQPPEQARACPQKTKCSSIAQHTEKHA
eukprot:scaffold80815_cov17-Tisochrysis_lutea.AAC.1